jgi:hypothetical protein
MSSAGLLPHRRRSGHVTLASPAQFALDRANAPIPSLPGAPLPPGSNRKKQRSSTTNPDRQLFRSSSTSHLRGPIMSESDLDKKRNKLGYQRISIACGQSHPSLHRPSSTSSISRSSSLSLSLHKSPRHAPHTVSSAFSLTIVSPLPPSQNQVLVIRRPFRAALSELRSTQEGVCLLSCRPASRHRSQVRSVQVSRTFSTFVCSFQFFAPSESLRLRSWRPRLLWQRPESPGRTTRLIVLSESAHCTECRPSIARCDH